MPDVSSGGLPRPLTSFIGREHELAHALALRAEQDQQLGRSRG